MQKVSLIPPLFRLFVFISSPTVLLFFSPRHQIKGEHTDTFIDEIRLSPVPAPLLRTDQNRPTLERRATRTEPPDRAKANLLFSSFPFSSLADDGGVSRVVIEKEKTT
jgi:hypothetical protein